MKLLFVYRYLTIGGVETVLRARMQHLDQAGIEAWAWFLNEGSGSPMFSPFGERVLIGDTPSIRSFILNASFSAATTIDTPEVIELFNTNSTPIFVESHSPYLENLTYLKGLQARQIAAVITPTQHQQAIVEDLLSVEIPVFVIPNILAAEYYQVPTEKDLNIPRPIIGWVGRMDALKNWKGFLRVGKRIGSKTNQFELMMVGDFPSKDSWRSLYKEARSTGVLSRLRWFKSLQPNLMPNYYDYLAASGGVLVSTSKGESFGMSVAEAMARSCPVIAPNKTPFTEFIEDRATGFLYKNGNYDSAAEIIHDLLVDLAKQEEIGQSARQSIVSAYSPASIMKELIETISTNS